MDQMIDYSCYCKNASKNTNHVYEKTMPLVMRVDMEDSHWICLISIFKHFYLKYTIGSCAKITSFKRAV